MHPQNVFASRLSVSVLIVSLVSLMWTLVHNNIQHEKKHLSMLADKMPCWCVRGSKSGGRTARQGRFGGKGGKGSPTLLSHLNAVPGPDPSLSTVDGSGSESVKSLRRRETHVHLNQRCIYTGPFLL